MAGYFELVKDPEGCRVKVIDGSGAELAVSSPYRDVESAVRGINAFREIAATAVVKDETSTSTRATR